MTSTFGMIATLGYSLAAVFALLAVVYYFLRHVRAVRDELTGRTAQREIADMRAGRRGHSWLGSKSFATPAGLGGSRGAATGEGSGSLHVRNVEAPTNIVTPMPEGDSELGTTLLSAQASTSAPETEAGTTLLGASPAAPASVETKTETAETEMGTTLLTSQPDTEAGTTLLSNEGEVRK